MRITALPQFKRNARRFQEIVSILVKYGLANWIRKTDPEFIKGLFKGPEGVKIADLSEEARIRMALTDLGTTFIKLGQILSTRPDVVGPELAAELAELQSDTPPEPAETIRSIIEEELGRPVGELFSTFEDQAMASASIGQVHRARLPGGRDVVVKVQRSGIEDRVTSDLDILMALAELAEKYSPELSLLQPRALVAEFRRILVRELDYNREERNLEQFQRNFEGDDDVHIPRAYPELSSRRVLTMERLEGVSVAHVDRLKEMGTDTEDLAVRGANMYLDMIFRDGFYHADPHPGNIWVLTDGSIGLLDCGMVGVLDRRTMEDVEGLLVAVVRKDPDLLTDNVTRIGSLPPGFDRRALETEITEYVRDYTGQALDQFDLSGALNDMTDIIRRYRIMLPSSIALLLKVLVMLEGTSRTLSRDFSLAELIEPYYRQALLGRMGVDRIVRRMSRSYRDWERLVDMLPRNLVDILSRVREGSFDVNLQHRHLDTVVNRLVYGILTAALIVASALLWSRATPPLFKGVSIVGAIGFLVSFGLAFRILRAIRKSGSLE